MIEGTEATGFFCKRYLAGDDPECCLTKQKAKEAVSMGIPEERTRLIDGERWSRKFKGASQLPFYVETDLSIRCGIRRNTSDAHEQAIRAIVNSRLNGTHPINQDLKQIA